MGIIVWWTLTLVALSRPRWLPMTVSSEKAHSCVDCMTLMKVGRSRQGEHAAMIQVGLTQSQTCKTWVNVARSKNDRGRAYTSKAHRYAANTRPCSPFAESKREICQDIAGPHVFVSAPDGPDRKRRTEDGRHLIHGRACQSRLRLFSLKGASRYPPLQHEVPGTGTDPEHRPRQ